MNQSKLTISLLGGVTIALDDTAVSNFASRKADALFIYLACNPRPHPRETLATLLWPDNDQTRALANLSVILSSLRKQLSDYLLADRHTIAINTEAEWKLDVTAFEKALEAAQKRQQGNKITRTVAAQLQTAVAHYKGDFLAGFNVRGVPEFEAWVLLEQERLRQLMLDALSDLISFYQQRGQLTDGIQCAQQLLALDPLQEETHRQLMLLYAQDNRRPAALSQFEQCATILADELGVEPDEETTALYEEIKNDKVTATPVHPGTPLPGHNLPVPTTSFIGREDELAQIENWLMEVDGRLLTIIGPGGMGKTRLAQQAARAHLGEFADGVWYVSLVPLTAADELVTAVAETIGLTFASSIDPATQLVSYLASKEMFLILDNFEHLVNDKSLTLLTKILQQAPEGKLLVTSRERLGLQAERLLELGGLPYPVTRNVASRPLTDFPAVRLFANRASQLRADFSLVGVETAVTKLCQLIDGLPLALELAATWSHTLTVTEIVVEIEQGIDFLATNMRDLPVRHRSVRAVFDYSWQLLTPTEQDVFSCLSVCRGGFSREAARQIANASLPTLSSLIDKSFMRLDTAVQGKAARYRRHPLLIQFAAEKLYEQPEKLAKSQQRLAYHIAETLANQTNQFHGPERLATMALLGAEHENVRFAWEWAIENAPELLVKLAPSYQNYLIGAGLFAEGYDKFKQATTTFQQPSQQLWRAQMLVSLCLFARLVGQTKFGKEKVLESLAILDRLPAAKEHADVEALALKQYGALLFSDENSYAEAEKINKQALSIFQARNDLVGQGDIFSSLGIIAYYQSNYQRAKRFLEDSLRLQQRASNQIGQIKSKQVLGLIQTSLGNFGEGIAQFQECIVLAEAAQYKVDVPWHHLNLGYAYLLAGKLEDAQDVLQKSVIFSLEQGDPQAISGAYSLLGIALLHNGRFASAGTQAQQGLQYSQEPGFYSPFYKGFALQLLGAVALAEQYPRHAYEQLAEAGALFREIEHWEYLSWSLPMQLIAACALKRARRAKALAQETVELAQNQKAYMPKLLLLTALAIWCCQQNEVKIGGRLWATVLQEALVKKSAWFQTVAQQQLQPTKAPAQGQVLDFAECVGLVRPLLP